MAQLPDLVASIRDRLAELDVERDALLRALAALESAAPGNPNSPAARAARGLEPIRPARKRSKRAASNGRKGGPTAREAILAAVAEHGPGVPARTIAEAHGLKVSSVSTKLARMRAAGEVPPRPEETTP